METKFCTCGGILNNDPYFNAMVCNTCGKMIRHTKVGKAVIARDTIKYQRRIIEAQKMLKYLENLANDRFQGLVDSEDEYAPSTVKLIIDTIQELKADIKDLQQSLDRYKQLSC